MGAYKLWVGGELIDRIQGMDGLMYKWNSSSKSYERLVGGDEPIDSTQCKAGIMYRAASEELPDGTSVRAFTPWGPH